MLDEALAKGPYLAGDEFSIADVAVGGYLLYTPIFGQPLPTKQARVLDYMKRLAARPACPQAFKEGMAAAVGSSGGGGGLGGILDRITKGG